MTPTLKLTGNRTRVCPPRSSGRAHHPQHSRPADRAFEEVRA